MLMIISPAKKLDETTPTKGRSTQPLFMDESAQLIKKLRTYSKKGVGELMHLSDNLSALNYDRYKNWAPPFNKENAKQALMAFKGDVYQGIGADDFDSTELSFSQKHLRILSGLHGLLRPLDLIQPYRLEMGTKLPTRNGKNLYEFWDDKIKDTLQKDLKKQGDEVLLNLASAEYFKAARLNKMSARVVTPVCWDFKDGKYKPIQLYVKRGRGYMARYIIKNKLTNVEDLKGFNLEGYSYNDRLSEGDKWVFTRDSK